jgi:hypothetical protein
VTWVLYRNNGLAGDKRSSPAAAGKDGSNKVGHVQLCPSVRKSDQFEFG